MFPTLRYQPGTFRQLSISPKFFFGKTNIYIFSSSVVTEEDIRTAAVYKNELEAAKIIHYNPEFNTDQEIPSVEICKIVKTYFGSKNATTIYHIDEVFALVKELALGVKIIEVAGDNLSYANLINADKKVNLRETAMVDTVGSVKELLKQIELQ